MLHKYLHNDCDISSNEIERPIVWLVVFLHQQGLYDIMKYIPWFEDRGNLGDHLMIQYPH